MVTMISFFHLSSEAQCTQGMYEKLGFDYLNAFENFKWNVLEITAE